MKKIFKITCNDSVYYFDSELIRNMLNIISIINDGFKVEEIDLQAEVNKKIAEFELVNVPDLKEDLDGVVVRQEFEKIIERHCVPGTNGMCDYDKAAKEIYDYLKRK